MTNNKNKTHCQYGHPFDEANTYRYTWQHDGRTRRACLTCMAERTREYRHPRICDICGHRCRWPERYVRIITPTGVLALCQPHAIEHLRTGTHHHAP